MTFEFGDQRYRIAFQHEKLKSWDAHPVPHVVTLVPEGTHLYCETCRVRLAGMSPEIARKLRGRLTTGTACARDHASLLAEAEFARNVRCTIYLREGDAWVARYSGVSRLNTAAGDRYEREPGRLAALRAALPRRHPEDESLDEREMRRGGFCASAMRAYLERPRGNKAAVRESGGAA